MNNIEEITGLSSCEMLTKLDLTMNFIRKMSNFQTELGGLVHLKELYFTGNPVAKFPNFKNYLIKSIPSVQKLDGEEISRTEKIAALQELKDLEANLPGQNFDVLLIKIEAEHAKQRQLEAAEYKEKNKIRDKYYEILTEAGEKGKDIIDENGEVITSIDQIKDPFEDEAEAYTPESRVAAVEHMRKKKELSEKLKDKNRIIKEVKKEKRKIRFFDDSGNPVNINQGKFHFEMRDDDASDRYLFLEIFCGKFIHTKDIVVDLQPNYVKILFKDKYLQLTFFENIVTDSEVSTCKRSETTGHLLLTLQKESFEKQGSKISSLTQPESQKSAVEKVEERRRKKELKNLEVDDLDDLPPLI